MQKRLSSRCWNENWKKNLRMNVTTVTEPRRECINKQHKSLTACSGGDDGDDDWWWCWLLLEN